MRRKIHECFFFPSHFLLILLNLVFQCTGNEMQDHCDLAYQSMLEPLLDVVECENDSEIGITSHVSLQNLSRESTKV